ncbi:MAG: hypothetical protein ACLFN0_05605 [Thermovirgaceae bacterium]
MRRIISLGLTGILAVTLATSCYAASFDKTLQRWQKTQNFGDSGEQIEITATYYAAEYIEALAQKEAETNLWTADELEQYKYRLLTNLKLEDTIPVHIKFKVRGPSLHLAPFGEQIWLRIGGERYSPVEYDPRFNFKISDERDGMIHFPRYDEKTGEDLLEGADTVKLEISGSVSMAIKPHAVEFYWDVNKDDPSRFYTGEAGQRLERDRLINRLEKLNDKKSELEKELADVTSEITQIEQRLEELQ